MKYSLINNNFRKLNPLQYQVINKSKVTSCSEAPLNKPTSEESQSVREEDTKLTPRCSDLMQDKSELMEDKPEIMQDQPKITEHKPNIMEEKLKVKQAGHVIREDAIEMPTDTDIFIEINRILGVEHITAYLHSLAEDMHEVLYYYCESAYFAFISFSAIGYSDVQPRSSVLKQYITPAAEACITMIAIFCIILVFNRMLDRAKHRDNNDEGETSESKLDKDETPGSELDEEETDSKSDEEEPKQEHTQ